MAFQTRKNLPKGVIFTAKDMRYGEGYGRIKKNVAMKQLLDNKVISKVLDKKFEQTEFLEALKTQAKKKPGYMKNINRNDLRKVLGDFRSGKGKTIDKWEGMKIASEFTKQLGKKKYIFERDQRPDPVVSRMEESEKNSPVVNPKGSDGASLSKVRSGSSVGRSFSLRGRLF